MNFADSISDFEDWEISDRYQISRLIGSGSYGDVVEGEACEQISVSV
jgi:hypothetical protein